MDPARGQEKLLAQWVLNVGLRALVLVTSARLWPAAGLGSILTALGNKSWALSRAGGGLVHELIPQALGRSPHPIPTCTPVMSIF